MQHHFDEDISLRRLSVALRRSDWRMFQQGLGRLDEELEAGAQFPSHAAWQDLLTRAEAEPELPPEMLEGLRDAITRLLAIEARVAPPSPEPPQAPTEDAIVFVAAWTSTFGDETLLGIFGDWIRGQPASAARGQIDRWLAEGVGLDVLVNRANLTMAAAHNHLPTPDPLWVDLLFAGLAFAMTINDSLPPLRKLGEWMPRFASTSLVVGEPSLLWEQFYQSYSVARTAEEARLLEPDPQGPGGSVGPHGGPGGQGAQGTAPLVAPASRGRGSPSPPPNALQLVKLAGSFDWFYCHSCHHLQTGADPSGRQPLAVACPRCAAPAWPLMVPVDNPYFHPTALRDTWAWGGELLRAAPTWVLVDPAPAGKLGFHRWLRANLSPMTRVIVISEASEVRDSWQALLEGRRPGPFVASNGPADDALPYLLRGDGMDLRGKGPPESVRR